ncbi:MAG TPA: YggS family pyridoxal phosphate enzyme [Pirellulaceae bacterium]|nr:YggS family pyridoxal phosphate enzyme [Pirellulaceae bacterium]
MVSKDDKSNASRQGESGEPAELPDAVVSNPPNEAGEAARRESIVRANVAAVRERIAAAAARSGRRPDSVRLVAVTKYVGCDEVRALIAAGCRDFGENRPQQLWEKAETLRSDWPPSVGAGVEPVARVEPAASSSGGIRWHLIGHLQRNKVRRTLPLVSLLHAGDSERLLAEVDREAAGLVVPAGGFPVLLEVNVSGDVAKHGFRPDELASVVARASEWRHLRLAGLMAMSGLESDEDETRREFARVRELREALVRNAPPNAPLDELSMGMSGDFEAAIAEGATLVRIGSALFEGLAT